MYKAVEKISERPLSSHEGLITGVHGVTGTVLGTEDVDDTPVDGATTDPVSSNWAYDHAADLAAHIASFMQKTKTGNYFYPFPYRSASSITPAANRMHAFPFIVARNLTIDRLLITISAEVADYTTGTATFTNASDQVVGDGTTFASAHVGRKIKLDADAAWHTIKSVEDATHLTLTAAYSAAGGSGAYTIRATARLGIYKDGTNLYPGTLVKDYGLVEVNAIAEVYAEADQALTKGLYWQALVSNGAPTIYAFYPTWGLIGEPATLIGQVNYVLNSYYKADVGTGALADPFVAGGIAHYFPIASIMPRLKTLD